MGKAGKLRKKRKNEELINSCMVESHIESDTSDYDEEPGSKKSSSEVRLSIAKSVFGMLSERLDLFGEARMKPLRKALYPIVQLQQGHFFEPSCLDIARPSDTVANQVLSDGNLTVAIQVLTQSAAHPDEYLSAEKKHLRKAIHPLVVHHLQQGKGGASSTAAAASQTGGDNSLTSRISSYFRTRQWSKALSALQEMYLDDNEVPKLGSVQRWVRECDVSAEHSGGGAADSYASLVRNVGASEVAPVISLSEDPAEIKRVSLQLLYAVMKVMVSKLDKAAVPKAGDDPNCNSKPAVCTYLPPFTVATSSESRRVFCPSVARAVLTADVQSGAFKGPVPVPVLGSLDEFRARISVISHVPGPERRPPVPHDLNIYMTAPRTIALEPNDARSVTVTRHDVPGVPGAFLLQDVLSVSECCQFVLAAEQMQYAPDTVDGIEGVVWLGDDSIMEPLFARIRHLMPQTLDSHELCGVNARLRLFRYSPGAVYRPHIDGAWPGSGVLPSGEYTDDAYGGTQHTRLTFLVYLTDGFTGGATTFFLPKIRSGDGDCADGEDLSVNTIEARSVRPVQGSVLCFPHGSAMGSLVHEGSAVHQGTKYVIRSDVRYTA